MKDVKMLALMGKTRVALEEVQKMLDESCEEVKQWEGRLINPLSADEVRALHKNLTAAYARLRVAQDYYDTLLDFMRKVISQHMTADIAYKMGWEERLTDIVARLNARDKNHLSRALLEIENGGPLPF